MLTLVFFIGLLMILFVLGIPVCVSIGLTCLAVLWFENGLTNIPLSLLALKMMHGVNNFPLLAVPFFILAANVMNKGSVTPRIFNFANSLVGHLRGGLIPGIMLGLALMIMTVVLSYRLSMPIQPKPPFTEILRLSRRAGLSLMTPVIIVGGIWSGLFTPTESGAVASSYAIFLGTVVYPEIGVKELVDVFKNTIEFTAIILFIISIAGLYGWLLVRLQIPLSLAEGVVKLTTNPTLLLLILMMFFLIIGCFMSVIESVLIFTPIMVPMVQMMGIDPLFFGVFMVISLSVGVITPPFGNVIYVLVGITDQLRQLLKKPEIILMAACYDALSAKLVESAGFTATFMSGFGVAATRLDLPA